MYARHAAAAAFMLIFAAFGWAAIAAPAPEGWDEISITRQADAGAGKKAILIANSEYRHVTPLPGPPHDVGAMASQLSQLGFETTILRNPTSGEIVQAIAAAKPKGGARAALLAFYYSGHAAEVDGENSLLLTDYDPSQGGGDQVLSLQTVLTLLSAASFDKVFVAFDACRALVNTNAGRGPQTAAASAPLPAGVRGLARAESDFRALNRKEYAVLFSTSHGEPALDSTVAGVSPFTRAFVAALGRETSFVPAMLLAKRITEEITKGAQSPDVQIKWNSDITYARSSAVTNSASYILNDKIPAASMAAASIDLAQVTTVESGEFTHTVLNLKDENFTTCKEAQNKPFFWYADVSEIEYCALPHIGYSPPKHGGIFNDSATAAVYNSSRYDEASWKFDLDFDGSPEIFRASLRNAGMALTVTSKTSEFDFEGLLGPNIKFVGLYDFNKDGILDVLIVSSTPAFRFGDELIILDGRKIAKQLKTVVPCKRNATVDPATCERLLRLRTRMKGSLFAYELAESYYGADILQAAIYADWNIKSWAMDENGVLSLTTYSATWPYERNQPSDFMVDKKIAFDAPTGRLNIDLAAEKSQSLSLATLETQIEHGLDESWHAASGPTAPERPSWCSSAKTSIERLICDSAELSASENRVRGLFMTAVGSTRSANVVKRRARIWLSVRNACASQPDPASRTGCVGRVYERWIAELAAVPR